MRLVRRGSLEALRGLGETLRLERLGSEVELAASFGGGIAELSAVVGGSSDGRCKRHRDGQRQRQRTTQRTKTGRRQAAHGPPLLIRIGGERGRGPGLAARRRLLLLPQLHDLR